MLHKGRLSPSEMFPAGESGYRVRYLDLGDRDRTRVRVVERGAENGPPLLLLHGWGCSAFEFHRNIPALSDAGVRVICPDLKGHGLSDKPVNTGAYTTARMVEHVTAIADALGLRCFAIAGHSMGAALALRFAIAKPQRVSALGLLSPVGTSGIPFLGAVRTVTPQWSIPIWRSLNTRWMTRFFLWIAYGKLGSATNEEIDEYWAPSQFPEFTNALRNLAHELHWGPFYVGGLDALGIPVMLMSGSRDHLCRRKTREQLCKALKCQMIVVNRAGHLILSEIPDAVNAAMLDLMKLSSKRSVH